jgi:hypothetical protein
VSSCSLVENYRRFGGMRHLHLHSKKIDTAGPTETSEGFHQTERLHSPEVCFFTVGADRSSRPTRPCPNPHYHKVSSSSNGIPFVQVLKPSWSRLLTSLQLKSEGKGTAVPLQAWTGPECSRKLRFPDFVTTAQDGGKVVNFTHRPPLPPGNTPGTHFC